MKGLKLAKDKDERVKNWLKIKTKWVKSAKNKDERVKTG